MAQYPGAIPTLREVENDEGVIYDANAKKVVFAEDINKLAEEIVALATILGVNPQNAFATVSARIQNAYNWGAQADGKATTAQAGVTALQAVRPRQLRVLGSAVRDNVELNTNPVNDDNWRYVRNTANNANLSVPFTNTTTSILIEAVIVIWSNTDAYKELRCRVDGVVVGDAFPVSYLLNGVAPGLARFRVSVPPGNHTLTLEWRRNGGASGRFSYRNVDVQVCEILPD